MRERLHDKRRGAFLIKGGLVMDEINGEIMEQEIGEALEAYAEVLE